MINRFEINFIHMDADDNLRKYVTKKIGSLDRYMPRSAVGSAHAEVLLKERKAGRTSDGRDCCAEITLHLPHDTINVSETSINMFTAIDIAELKLKQQIKKYKELHSPTFRRRLTARFSRHVPATDSQA